MRLFGKLRQRQDMTRRSQSRVPPLHAGRSKVVPCRSDLDLLVVVTPPRSADAADSDLDDAVGVSSQGDVGFECWEVVAPETEALVERFVNVKDPVLGNEAVDIVLYSGAALLVGIAADFVVDSENAGLD